MFVDDQQRTLLTILIELRNIHTHNRGIVNQLFLNRIGDGHSKFKFVLGEHYHVVFDGFVLLSRNAIEVAKLLDKRLIEKFGLKHARYKSRLRKDSERRSNTNPT
jgi:hypothetical protein